MARVMRVRGTAASNSGKADSAVDVLHSIAVAMREVAALNKRIEEQTAVLYRMMKASKVVEADDTLATAVVHTPIGRSSTWIDPVKFRKAVADDKTFYASVSVGVKAAKQVLGQKEIDAISVKTPGAPGEETVKITLKD